MSTIYYAKERCVMCGQIIPEGRQVCADCEYRVGQGIMPHGRKVRILAHQAKKSSLWQRVLSLLGEMTRC